MSRRAHSEPERLYSHILIGIAAVVCFFLFRILHFLRVRGEKHVPRTGAVILAPNHSSFYDPPLVAYVSGHRRIFFLAWDALFRPMVFGPMIRRMGAVPVEPHRGLDRTAYTAALRLLRLGKVLCIFPEGGRSDTGRLKTLRNGVARLAVETSAPIVPVHIRGTFAAWSKQRRFPRFLTPVSVEFFTPIHPVECHTPEARKLEVDRLMRELSDVYTKVAQDYSSSTTN